MIICAVVRTLWKCDLRNADHWFCGLRAFRSSSWNGHSTDNEPWVKYLSKVSQPSTSTPTNPQLDSTHNIRYGFFHPKLL